MTLKEKWEAVISNNTFYDGSFVYAIKTTGIYCKPSCKSRTPKPENIVYFDTGMQAEKAGFRACKRCFINQKKAEELIIKACEFITNQEFMPKLEEVASHIGQSPNHFQKLFCEVVGISPRSFSDSKRQKHFKKLLQNGDEISAALYEAGFSSSSRVYEFANRYLGMTPKEYKKGGKNQKVWFTVVSTELGYLQIAATEKGICSVILGSNKIALQKELEREFHAAELIASDEHLKNWTQSLIDYISGKSAWPTLPYDLQATAFQRKVWEWLRTIPAGETYNYSEVAKAIGQPKAARAVARACASNPVALVIPCHRIIPKSGGVGGYRWNPKRKQKLLELEAV